MRFVFHLVAKKRNLASKTILTQSSEKQTAVTKAMWGRGTSDLVISLTLYDHPHHYVLKFFWSRPSDVDDDIGLKKK